MSYPARAEGSVNMDTNISSLKYSCMHMMFLFCSAATQVTLFEVLILNVAILTMFLVSNFGLVLSSIADFFNTWARGPTSAEHSPCLLMGRMMQLGHAV